LIMISFESTSNFFCSSPWTFVIPAAPMLHIYIKHIYQFRAPLLLSHHDDSNQGRREERGEKTDRLRRRALRTLVAMNLQVVWMAVRRMVRSPLAWGVRACEFSTWRVLSETWIGVNISSRPVQINV
jgi:hypothetical protein